MRCEGWHSVPLSEICEIIMGQSPNGENCNAGGHGLPLLNGPTEFGSYYPKPVQWTTDVKKECEYGDLLFCVRGSTTGRMNWADQKYAIGRGLAAIRHKYGIEYRYFVKGLIDYILPTILNATTGSTFPNVSKDLINGITVLTPPLPEQRAIAATLSCLDDKIELNNRMNKTLEEIAQAIFKSWFVDFEPFQNGEFVDSELGRIPKGWRVGTLGELVETSKAGDWGKDSKESNYTEQVLCIRGADIPEIQNGESGKMVCRYIIPKNLTKRLSENSIVVEISGGSPTQSTGRIAFITHEFLCRFPTPVICTNFCKALGISAYYGEYVYFRWQMLYMDGILFNYENGTTGIKNFDISNFLTKHLVVLPSVEVAKAFSTIVTDLMQMIVSNGTQNIAIRTIRDSLLPKLMNGEVTVTECEEA